MQLPSSTATDGPLALLDRPTPGVPLPLHTTVIDGDHALREAFAVVRIWTRADADRCRLCHVCEAARGPVGLDLAGRRTRLMVCTVAAVGPPLDDESAPLFSPDGLAG